MSGLALPDIGDGMRARRKLTFAEARTVPEEPDWLKAPALNTEPLKPTAKVGAWLIETDEAFLAREFPADEWLIVDLLPANQLTILFAGPSVGKTFTALDWAYEVAASGKRVLVIEAEGSGRKFQKRVRRARAAHEPIHGSVHIVFRPVGFSFTHKPDQDWLITEAKAHECDLVVIDSMSACTDADENDEMRRIAEALRTIYTSIGCALLVLHHMVKDAWRPNQRPTLASLRGPGPLAAATDTAIALTKPDAREVVAGLVRFNLWVMKHRDEQEGAAFSVEVLMTGDAATVTMEPHEPAAPRGANSEPIASGGDLKARVLEAIRQKPDSGSGVTRRLHANKATVLQLCTDLEAEGAVDHLGTKYYVKTVPAVPTGSTEPLEPVSGNGSTGSIPIRNREPEPIRRHANRRGKNG